MHNYQHFPYSRQAEGYKMHFLLKKKANIFRQFSLVYFYYLISSISRQMQSSTLISMKGMEN